MIDLLEQVIHDACKSEAPEDWRDVILVSLHKKGKFFFRIILNRLIGVIVSNILPEPQYGSHTNCGTLNMIFSAQQLKEKCREQNLPLYHYFIDL